ncbi:glycosyltransferase [Phenylobacterium deserti]|uniref:Group 1 glycosyl transferase n=1 Tax=Phenylobacterium deserti TaxID=1914756 RepID=A0A328AE54_9CAUL|nr:glycosyltransferase [Phenylobacterium deserti]RAK52929.1 group 1 glycosyl transferase [Phenylobacterium deserti]
MARGVLFVHNNFPAQFRDLAAALVKRDIRCMAIGSENARGLEGVLSARYRLSRGTTKDILQIATRAEADLLRGRAAWRAAKAFQDKGMEPEVIIGHAGWGETSLLKDVFPNARQALFAEFFYHARGMDVGFDPEFSAAQDEEGTIRVKAKNAVMSLAYTDADAIVAPTEFQRSSLPPVFREKTRVIHEGIDVQTITPGAAAPFALDDGRVIQPGTPVITHINNKMEPLRGLHIFARALPRLLREIPNAQVIVIGQEGRSGYGGDAPGGKTWKEVCFEGVEFDPARVHFLGRVPHERMLAALRLSTAHVYYTYPFVLSWSLSEAMASGCYVIGSDTAPLRDAIEDGVNGRLLPFFDHDALASALIEACRNPEVSAPLRAAAREKAVELFDRDKGRAAWFQVLRDLGMKIPG